MPRAGGTGGALGNREHAGPKRVLLLSQVSLADGENSHAALGTRHNVQGSRAPIARVDWRKSPRWSNLFASTILGPRLAMIGVLANQADVPTVREFFELFKTPWEFY